MRRHPALRRTSALAASTALISAVGLSTGVFVGIANAAPTGITPNALGNSTTGTTTFTLSGSGFLPTDTITLVPTTTPDSTVANYLTDMTITGTTSATATTPTSLTFTATITNAAPEYYNVVDTPAVGTATTLSSALFIGGSGRPTINSVVGAGAGTFTITGTKLAKGAKFEWLEADGTTVDPAMTFSPGTGTGTKHVNGYTSSTSTTGTYTATSAATSGVHYLRVTNTDGQQSNVNTVEFWQPKFTSLAPAKLGQGATAVPVTATGKGIRTGSTLSIPQYSSTVSDITIGTATTAADNTSVTAPVSAAINTSATAASVRAVTVYGPDGGFATLPSALTITLPPTIDDQTVNDLGQGGSEDVTITGTDFQPGIVFSTDVTGVTFATKSVATDGTSAVVTIHAAANATVGAVETVTATNPDHGTGSDTDDGSGIPAPLGNPALFSIDAAPLLTAISPGSTTAGATAQTITLTGTGFDTNGMTFSFGPTITVVSSKVASATSATVVITVPLNAAAGPQDVTLTNTADHGTSTCSQCFGIDGIGISPSGSANTVTDLSVTLSAKGSTALTGATGVVLSKKVATADQPDIPGTSFVVSSATAAAANFDLTAAAPGYYNAIITLPSGQVSCTGCFRVTAQPITASSVSPNTGGAGATDFPITIKGSSFSHGETVTIAGTTVSDVTYVDPSTLTAKVTIPAGTAAKSAINVVVTAADSSSTSTITGGYNIVAAPTVTKTETATPDKKSLGQGATNQSLTITGTGFTSGSTATFSGTGVTAGAPTSFTATTLVVPVTVASDATLGDYSVTVVQTDNGGQSAPFNAITVTAKPVPSLVAPGSIPAGSTVAVKVSGQGFQSASVLSAAGISFANTTLNSDGTLSADATVPGAAVGGARAVKVTNPDGGVGTCTCTITVQLLTKLTVTFPKTSVAGTADTFSGQLLNANTGAALSGLVVSVKGTPDVGTASTTSSTTTAGGSYARTMHPLYTTRAYAYFVGDATHTAASTPVQVVSVSTKVTLTSPKTGSSSKTASVLVFKGATSPNKAGRIIGLYREFKNGYKGIAQATVASNGTYTITVKLPKGSYYVKTGVGPSTGNTTGYCTSILIHRT